MKKNEQKTKIQTYLTADQLQKLKEVAAEEKRKISQMVSVLIDEALMSRNLK